MSEQELHDEDFLNWLSDVATEDPKDLPMELEYELVELTRRVNRSPVVPWTPALLLGLVLMIVIGLGAPGVWSGIPFLVLIGLGLLYAVGMRVVIREHSGGMSSPMSSQQADVPV